MNVSIKVSVSFPLAPEEHYGIFDFQDLGFCVVALNSCFNNDPLHRAGAFHPTAFTEACRILRHPDRTGWLTAARGIITLPVVQCGTIIWMPASCSC